jgi:hypothetical protein
MVYSKDPENINIKDVFAFRIEMETQQNLCQYKPDTGESPKS